MPTNRLLVIVLAVVSLAAAACGDDGNTSAAGGGEQTSSSTSITTTPGQTVEPGHFEPATEGTLATWGETAGECQVCGYALVFDADGMASYQGYRTQASVPFDVAELVGLMTRVDHQPLSESTDDCMREVDGNAPVLELVRADGTLLTADDCYRPIDRSHPLMEFVLDVLAEAREAEVATLVDVIDAGGLCPSGGCRATTTVLADGTVVHVDDGGATTRSTISGDLLEDLRTLVDDADVDDLVLGPFTGPCPTAVDGQERSYVIGGDENEEPIRLSACRDELDPSAPLLALVDRLVSDAVSG